MTELMKPLYTATINDKELRFYKSPMNEGPDFPWHCVDDLMICIGLPRSLRRKYAKDVHHMRVNGTKTVATKDGIISIAPSYHAQGFLDAMVEVGMTTPEVVAKYHLASTKACDNLTGGLDFNSGLLEWLALAMKKNGKPLE